MGDGVRRAGVNGDEGGVLCVLPPPLSNGQRLGTFGAVTVGGCDWPPVGGGRGCCRRCCRAPEGPTRESRPARKVCRAAVWGAAWPESRQGRGAALPRGDRGAPGAKSESTFGPRARLRREVGAVLPSLVADAAGDQGSLDGMFHFPCVCFCVYSKREGKRCGRIKSFFSSS